MLKYDVSSLNVSADTLAFLRNSEIRTIGALIHHSRDNLAKVGELAGIAELKLQRLLKEIELALAENGLRLTNI